MVADSSFLYDKSSIIVPEFVTELNENVHLYGEVSYFGKTVNAEDGIYLIKPEESNFALSFKSKIINDLTRFSFELLDGKQQKTKFDNSE